MKAWLVVLLLAVPATAAQDLGGALGPADALLGDTVPPALDTIYEAAGQNITREDMRMFLDMNITKGDVGIFGLLIGSGTAEVDAHISLRVEMRVISSDRVRAAVQGDNAYNMSAENATFLSKAYLPAEVFRASLSAEAIAAFQEEQEAALTDYIEQAVPELEILGLDVAWENTKPQRTIEDTSLTEPPIVVTIDTNVRYLRTESVGSLLAAYTNGGDEPEDPEEAKAKRMKEENGDPLHARDFFAAAAYTQLLNLSMQPGWSLTVDMRVPRGYSFEYANENVELHSGRHISFRIAGPGDDETAPADEEGEVYLVSLTHRRGVALALFVAMLAVGAVVGLPGWLAYQRMRVGPLDASEGRDAGTAGQPASGGAVPDGGLPTSTGGSDHGADEATPPGRYRAATTDRDN